MQVEMKKLSSFFRLLGFLGFGLILHGCAMVEVSSLGPREYIAMKRGDVLTAGEVSANTQQTTRVAGLDEGPCLELNRTCIQALSKIEGLAVDRKLSALAELWLKEAMRLQKSDDFRPEQKLDAWLQTARHAYAYLFYSDRTSSERAFEDRQTQVRDYYNYAVQESVTLLFQQRMPDIEANGGLTEDQLKIGDWAIRTDYNDIRLPEGVSAPKELIRASTLTFKGLRSGYRRDGFGAELVAVLGDDASSRETQTFSEMPSPTFTALLHFEGAVLEQVLSTRNVRLSVHDPYSTTSILIRGQTIPLAANFTAGYGLWLAQTDFATQSLLTLFGRDAGISKPHIFLMQPYDPNRRILLMLHGLGSSPEAWVNVANEVLGDESLRNEFQVWQVYYPTNIPISFNHAVIRKAVNDTLKFFDPSGKARSSQHMVVVGHSMGGVISRLMVSSSGNELLKWLREDLGADQDKLQAVESKLKPLVQFEPIPNISRAVFIAAPHRGTEFAGNRIGRWISSFIKLPITLLQGFEDVLMTIGRADPRQPDGKLRRIPNSIDNLDQSDPFIRAAARLPISPRVPYHSIIAKLKPEMALEQSDDGVVPYHSAHLAGAQSEKVIVSGHSVQETAAAVLEVRRILHEDVRLHAQETD
jgi:pimeloyl-ACP methyl ester carboxylesterase